jgi:hypothetical protein
MKNTTLHSKQESYISPIIPQTINIKKGNFNQDLDIPAEHSGITPAFSKMITKGKGNISSNSTSSIVSSISDDNEDKIFSTLG